jgi:hypothetical protein
MSGLPFPAGYGVPTPTIETRVDAIDQQISRRWHEVTGCCMVAPNTEAEE